MSVSLHCRQALLIGIAHAGTLVSLRFVKELLENPSGLSFYEQHWLVLTVFHTANPAEEEILTAAVVSTPKTTIDCIRLENV